ncbi:MAG TPA: PRC-barrel domain-containing protein [Gaiellaceae bacterium]
MTAPDPVSWKVVERGWRVIDDRGGDVGRVDEITGDPEADIFDGLEVSHGLLERTEYVPSERVVEIREGEVIIRR